MNTKDFTPLPMTLADHLAAETEGDRSPVQVLKAAQTVAETFVDQRLDEFERLAAADLVMKMRNVDAFAGEASDAERAKFAAIFERTGKQFEAAALRLKRARPHAGVPEYLREGSSIPMRDAI